MPQRSDSISIQQSVCVIINVAAKQNDRGGTKPAPPLSGTITGRIITDDGSSLVKANISVSPAGKTSLNVRPPIVILDEEGNFRISGLEPNSYYITVSLPGYISVMQEDQGSGPYYPGDSINFRLSKGGVISGRVTNSKGEPIVAAKVQAVRVEIIEGLLPKDVPANETQTDDRGIYRIYGLRPGIYIVRVGGKASYQSLPYDRYVPTYYPAGSRNQARTVTIQSGEAPDINIQFLGEHGHQISGEITGVIQSKAPFSPITVRLSNATDGGETVSTLIQTGRGEHEFTLSGLSDGEYWLTADRKYGDEDSVASSPSPITIKGADVTGLKLQLTPLSSVTGRITLNEASIDKHTASCALERKPTLEKTIITMRRDQPGGRELLRLLSTSFANSRPNLQGEFLLAGLEPGHYIFEVRLPEERWYINSITTLSRQSNNVASNSLTLKSGDRVTGLTIMISEGAAGIDGRAVSSNTKISSPSRLRVHLVPAEPEASDDLLRYAELTVTDGGKFKFNNIKPGRYWLLARLVPQNDIFTTISRPIAWDNNARAKLRREAEISNIVVELRPCQDVKDFILRF